MLMRSIVTCAAALSLSLSLVFPAGADDQPQPASTVLDAARTLAASGDYAGAAKRLTTYVDANPGDVPAQEYLGDLYVRMGDLKAAERTYAVVVRAQPQDRTAHERLGNAYADDDLLAEAIAEYQKSLPDVVAYSRLVRLHRKLGDLAQFVEKYNRMADSDFENPSAQLGYGIILRDLHRPAEAERYLQRAVVLTQGSCAARTELGNVDLDLDRQAAAAAEFRSCLTLEPANYSALVDLSLTYDPITDAAAARALLDRAIQLRPHRPEALIDYGYLADAAGRAPEGIVYYRRALEEDVLARDAYVDLGYDYSNERMYPLAEEVFLKGLSVSPKDGRIEYLLGETYSQQGKRSLAHAEFLAAAASDEPEVSRAALHRLEAE